MEPHKYSHDEVLALVGLTTELVDRECVRHIGALLNRVRCHFRADAVAAAQVQGQKVTAFTAWGPLAVRNELSRDAAQLAWNPNAKLDRSIASTILSPRHQLSIMLLSAEAGRFNAQASDSLPIIHSAVFCRLAELQEPCSPLHKARSPSMSPRLSQVMEGLMDGRSDKEIAASLGISRDTVHAYVKSLFKLRNVHSRAELLSDVIKAITPSADNQRREAGISARHLTGHRSPPPPLSSPFLRTEAETFNQFKPGHKGNRLVGGNPGGIAANF